MRRRRKKKKNIRVEKDKSMRIEGGETEGNKGKKKWERTKEDKDKIEENIMREKEEISRERRRRT